MDTFLKQLLFIITIISPLFSVAQRENDNWYFGSSGALNFPGGTHPVEKTDNAMKGWYASATASDKTTGQLLFYTDGKTVYNRLHQVMEDGDSIVVGPTGANTYITSTLIVPFPANPNRYYLFTVMADGWLRYAIVDMQPNGGLGKVVAYGMSITSYTGNRITAVKHAFTNDYWLITYHGSLGRDSFEVYPITPSGIKSPVLTLLPHHPGVQKLGTMVSNNAGDQLVITYFSDVTPAVFVFPFNKTCGTVGHPLKLVIPPGSNYPYGAAFAPQDKNLFVVFGHMNSELVMYNGANFKNRSVIATSDQNFNDVQLGPNGNIYISTHENNIPSGRIDEIQLPDMSAPSYVKEKLRISSPVYFEFPNFINDKSTPGGGLGVAVIRATNTCLGDTVKYSFSGVVPDSVIWSFGDTGNPQNTSRQNTTAHYYGTKGSYLVTLKWYTCGFESTATKWIDIIEPQAVSLGPDTVFCHNDSIQLISNISGGAYVWSTGETAETITVDKPGQYWVKITNGSCSGSDTIKIKQHPPILIELGGNYAICDDENETVKLDAGKGFDHYKWTPTGDTTQWIIVKKAGDYFVVVEDYRGCKGNDGTRVNHLCDFTFYMPNAFTPDGNGLNDIFMPTFSDISNYSVEIFNVWGEKVFESSDPSTGWDGTYKGKACPVGVYIWKVSYKGYHKKLFKNVNDKGVVHLVR